MYKICLAILVAVIFMGCREATKVKNDKKLQIPVVIIKKSNTLYASKKVAEIQAVKNVEIRSRIRGFLESILVDEGKEVKKGQPLFKLSSPEYTADFTKAEAALARAKAEEVASNLEVERVKILTSKNVVAESELVLAESKALVARATVSEANASLKNAGAFLSYTTLAAPFDGVINRIPLKIGSLINEGDLLTSISDISSIYAYFHMPEAEYLKYLVARKNGDSILYNRKVNLELADGSLYKYDGIVETVASEIDGKTGAIAFRAKFLNPEKLLKHGASGNVSLQTNIENAIMIPQRSVMEIQDKNYVFIVDSLNMIKMRNVGLGTRIGQNYLVISGLSVNEKIVLKGVQILREGNTIIPVEKAL